MRKANNKIYLIYLAIIGVILFNIFFTRALLSIYNTVVYPILWITTGLLTFKLLNERLKRQKYLKDKYEIVSIIMLFYFIIYFLLGLILTYTKSIYAQDILSILKNIWIYLSIIICKEYVRGKLVNNVGNTKIHYVIITVLMILVDVNFYNFSSYMSSSELIFKYGFQTLCPIIFANIVCTYVATVSNCGPNIIYRGILVLMKVIVPIQPRFDWFMYGMFESILPVLIFAIISYYHTHKTSRERKKKIMKENPVPKIAIMAVLVLFGFFVGGFFRYMPTAVMSGSMDPIFKRGDVVVLEKVDKNNFKKLEINDIIAYRLEEKIVLHRIVKIDTSGDSTIITTKGDNNDYIDNKPVTEDMVIGIIHFSIKYIGYPSVLLSEYFSK